MTKHAKLRARILDGQFDGDISFEDLCQFLQRLGFVERVRGDHHIFTRKGVDEIINLQPVGSKAKRYQVRQVREIVRRYAL